MNSTQPDRNPLQIALIGALTVGFLDTRFYFLQHHYVALGSAILIPIGIFIILFLSRSTYAWLAAIVAVFMMALTLILTYWLGYMGFSISWPLAIIDLLLFGQMTRLLWRARLPYQRYIAQNKI